MPLIALDLSSAGSSWHRAVALPSSSATDEAVAAVRAQGGAVALALRLPEAVAMTQHPSKNGREQR